MVKRNSRSFQFGESWFWNPNYNKFKSRLKLRSVEQIRTLARLVRLKDE